MNPFSFGVSHSGSFRIIARSRAWDHGKLASFFSCESRVDVIQKMLDVLSCPDPQGTFCGGESIEVTIKEGGVQITDLDTEESCPSLSVGEFSGLCRQVIAFRGNLDAYIDSLKKTDEKLSLEFGYRGGMEAAIGLNARSLLVADLLSDCCQRRTGENVLEIISGSLQEPFRLIFQESFELDFDGECFTLSLLPGVLKCLRAGEPRVRLSTAEVLDSLQAWLAFSKQAAWPPVPEWIYTDPQSPFFGAHDAVSRLRGQGIHFTSMI